MEEELVILVDKNDTQIGLMPKMEAHKKGVLHRAFSVFVLNDDGALMLQQRALHKYHSPGLWTNTCCSHQPLHPTHPTPQDGGSVCVPELDSASTRAQPRTRA